MFLRTHLMLPAHEAPKEPAPVAPPPPVYVHCNSVPWLKLRIFNFETKTWTTKKVRYSSGNGMGFGMSTLTVVPLGNDVYITGGQMEPMHNRSIYELNLHTMKLKKLGLAPNPRYFSGGIARGRKLYYFGGMSMGHSLDHSECYDVDSQTWTTLARMPDSMKHPSLCTIGDDIYVWNTDEFQRTCFRYSVTENTWSSANPPTAHFYNSITQFEGKLWSVGKSYYSNHTTLIYDPATREWTYGPDAPSSNRNRLVSVDNTLYLIGGSDQFERVHVLHNNAWTLLCPRTRCYQDEDVPGTNGGGFVVTDARAITALLK